MVDGRNRVRTRGRHALARVPRGRTRWAQPSPTCADTPPDGPPTDDARPPLRLELPGRPRVARTIEFGLPVLASVGAVLIQLSDAVRFASPIPSVFLIVASVYFGSGLSGQSVAVGHGILVIDNIIRSTVVRNAVIQRTVSSGPGNVVLVVKGHDDIVVHWSSLGIRFWRSNGQPMAAEIRHTYGEIDVTGGRSLSVERY